MKLDSCGNPHVAFYSADEAGILYATRGTPCDARSVAADVDPDTLNPKSKGKWVTATITASGAAPHDIDPASLTLNGVPAAKWSHEGDTLVAKFDRATFASTLAVGENIVTLTGRWTDGEAFSATDTIRLIGPRR